MSGGACSQSHSFLLSVRRALQGMTFGYKDQNWQEEEGVRVIHAALEVTGRGF